MRINLWVMVHYRIMQVKSLEVVKACASDIFWHRWFELGTKLSQLYGEVVYKTPLLRKSGE